MARVRYVTEIAFGVAPGTVPTAGQWVDLTSRVKSLTISRGRNRELDQFEPGTLTATLDDPSRDLEPDYAGSPYYPDVIPMAQIRVRAGDMAPSFVASSDVNANLVGPYSVATPTGALPGDLILLQFSSGEGAGVTIPAGWTPVPGANQGLHYRFLADEASFSFDVTVENLARTIIVVAFRNVDPVAPINASEFNTFGNGALSGVTTTEDNTLLVMMHTNLGTPIAPDVSMTERWDITDGSPIGTQFAEGATAVLASAGASGAKVPTSGNPNFTNNALLALSPGAYPRFYGYIDRWRPLWNRQAEVELGATDGMKVLQARQLANPYVLEVLRDSPYAYYRFGEGAVTEAAVDSSGNGRYGVYSPSGITFGQPDPITDDVDGAITLDGATGYVGVPPVPIVGIMAVEAWFKTTSATFQRILDQNHSGTVDLSLVVTSGGAVIFQYGQSATSGIWEVTSATGYNDGAWHHVVGLVDVVGGDMFIWVDGVEDSASSSTTGVPADPSGALSMFVGVNLTTFPQHFNGSLDEVAIYSGNHPNIGAHYAARTAWLGQTSGARVEAVLDQIGWPASLRNIDTGQSTLSSAGGIGGETALDHLMAVAATENGALYIDASGNVRFRERHAILKPPYTTSQGIFGDNEGELRFKMVEPEQAETLIYNEVRTQRIDGPVQVVDDAMSKTLYLTRSLPQSGAIELMLSNAAGTGDAEALEAARWLLARYKDPFFTIRQMVVQPYEDELVVGPVVLGLELEERVTVRRRPHGGTLVAQDHQIQRVSETWAAGSVWEMTFALSPAESGGYWIWDTATWDETTRWAY